MNFQPRGISEQGLQGPGSYQNEIEAAEALLKTKDTWNGITAEAVARMRLQNRFKTGLDIARYTAALMRADMAAYDGDPTKYTQSLGCWHGFIAQQKLISVKKHFRHNRSPLSVSVRLDDRSATFRVRAAARSVDAREDLGAGADRRALHLPASGRFA